MKKIAVLTSGGDSPGMNPAIRAVVRTSLNYNINVIGIKRGYSGLIEGDYVEMKRGSVADIVHKGGTILLAGRCEEFQNREERKKAYDFLQREGIEGLIVIGGDGTFRGAHDICEETDISVIGIPGTIDNDLASTDYTIGFDTAMNTILDAISKIRDTATSHERTFVVEIMGRDTGTLGLMAGLAGGAESILIPEFDYAIEDVVRKVENGYSRGKLHSIILMAEGVGENFQTDRDINESHAFYLSKEISKRTGLDTRVIILGHLQRGGNPTAFDRILASRMGVKAVELLVAGESDEVICYVKNEVNSLNITEALREKKVFNKDMYDLANMLAM